MAVRNDNKDFIIITITQFMFLVIIEQDQTCHAMPSLNIKKLFRKIINSLPLYLKNH